MKKHFTNKKLLSIILSILLLVHPAFPASVYAAEPEETQDTGWTADIPAEDAGLEVSFETPDTDAEEPAETSDGNNESIEEPSAVPAIAAESPDEAALPFDASSDIPEEITADETGSPEEAVSAEEALDPLLYLEEYLPEVRLPEDEAFTDFADSYSLSAEQRTEKEDAQTMIPDFSKAQEGVDYAPDEVFYFAKTAEEAGRIADAFHGELLSFQEGIATIRLSDFGVDEAVYTSMSMDINVPMVYPNYYRYIDGIGENDPAGGQIILDNDDVTVLEEVIDDDGGAVPYDETLYADGLPGGQSGSENNGGGIYAGALYYNDPYLSPVNTGFQWHHSVLGSMDAWYAGYTGKGVKVAVIDTGVNAHKDLNIAGSETVMAGLGGSGADWYGHGTAVCGTIGAVLNNGLGGAGVAPGVELYSIQASTKEGKFEDAYVLAALKKAISLDVDIINMSLGGYNNNTSYLEALNTAYEKGIIVVVSAGNENTNAFAYPASFDHVISVAATNETNKRAYFSTHNSAVDLSAPGVGICTTSMDGAYILESGTSFSSPIVAGQAALVLEAVKDLGIDPAKNKTRVDSVERLLKKGAFSCGSGMGSGIAFLPKALNTAAAGYAPGVPDMNVISAADGYTVHITAQKGAVIYYKTGSSKLSFGSYHGTSGSKNSIDIPVPSNYSGTYILQAFAANTTGEASKVKKIRIKFKAQAAAPSEAGFVTAIDVRTYTGEYQVAAGKSISCYAVITPYDATIKKVRWSVVDSEAAARDITAQAAANGFKISSAGKITTTKSVKPDTYYVCAAATDGSNVKGICAVTVISTQIKSLALRDADGRSCKSAVLFRTAGNFSAPTHVTFCVEITGSGTYTRNQFAYSQSRYGLVSVSLGTPSENRLPVTVTASGTAAGSVKITVRTIDGSNKKAVFTAKVVNPASGLLLGTPAKNGDCVLAGKSVKVSAKFASGFGKVTGKKVTWSVSDTSLASISKSGVLKAKKGSGTGIVPITVVATAADGSGVTASKVIGINYSPVTKVQIGSLASGGFYYDHLSSVGIRAPIGCTGHPISFQVTSSNPSVVAAYARGSSLELLYHKKGTVKITVKALDGGKGKSKSFNLQIR